MLQFMEADALGFSRDSDISYELRAVNAEVDPMISQAMVVKLLAKVFSIDSLGNVNCQSVTASLRYGNDRENNKPTIKPTKAAMAMAFLLRLRPSAACRFIISTEFKFR